MSPLTHSLKAMSQWGHLVTELRSHYGVESFQATHCTGIDNETQKMHKHKTEKAKYIKPTGPSLCMLIL